MLKKIKGWFYPVTKKLIIILAVVAVVLSSVIILAATKPSINTVDSRISTELKESSGKMYAQATLDFGIFNAVRGQNVKNGKTETYIGIAGDTKKVDDIWAEPFADIVFWMPQLLDGAGTTIKLTITSVTVGIFLSIFLALGKISKFAVLRWPCSAYIFFFRGTPLLMQLFFIYFGLPLINPAMAIQDRFLAAFIAFTLNTAAYVAEIIRAGIQSISKGQFEASKALGLSYAQTMSIIIIPQSIRRLLPPVANEFIMVLKDASLVSMIALSDLTHATRTISNSSSTVLVYIPAMIIYLIITAVFNYIFNKLEKRFSVYE
ncbi:MAG: amino acid ABC transporter permease [Oscillospiraceae bacterium]|jgi:polar amino acid transport system permease protein|nr:amino acid ABC transporter permease [Oscillospiraceae bacterium]